MWLRCLVIVALPVCVVRTIGSGIVSAARTIWLDILVDVEEAKRAWRNPEDFK